MPIHPHLRISDTEITALVPSAEATGGFAVKSWSVIPGSSLLVRLGEALRDDFLLSLTENRVEVGFSGAVTPVPLADFQEEDAEALHHQCFSEGRRGRVFYDPVPALNAVLLFSADPALCHRVEEALPQAHFYASLTPWLSRLARKTAVSVAHRLYVYVHDGLFTLALLNETRLLLLNTWPATAPTDVAYYALSALRQFGIPPSAVATQVSGDEALCPSVVAELSRHLPHAVGMSAASEFNRHPLTAAQGVSLDLLCAALK